MDQKEWYKPLKVAKLSGAYVWDLVELNSMIVYLIEGRVEDILIDIILFILFLDAHLPLWYPCANL
jgi:hypothetical protein